MKRFFATRILPVVLAFVSVAGVSLPAQTLKFDEATGITPQGSYTPDFRIDGSNRKVRNVILMIGDGMGLGAVNAGMYANNGELTMMNLKSMGYVRTQSASDFTTDSAASGTAYACGVKTYNGAIGMDADGNPVANLTEKLSARGYATGVITTDALTGATPAAFYAHQSSRTMSKEILADLPGSRLNFFAGGSRQSVERAPAETKDALHAGFDIVYSLADAPAKTRKLGYLPDAGEVAGVADPARKDFLPATTEFALNYLKSVSRKGFFVMIEGAHIDHSAHSNDLQGVVGEVLDFDKAVEAAIRFAEADGHTLVIISADHETGGISSRNSKPAEGYASAVFTTGNHSPITVPLFVYGPKSYLFTGVQENSDVSNKIDALLR